MSKTLELSFACGDYEITRPLSEGLVKPDGVELTILDNVDLRERRGTEEVVSTDKNKY